jgi:hypothetical protein
MIVNDWIEQFKQNLSVSGRFPTMRRALELLNKRNLKLIVETGTTRMKDDWGAGMSTYVFGSYCKQFDGHMWTVDIFQPSIELCKEITAEFADKITYVVRDSISFLVIFNQTIDFLYLDSMDCPEYDAPDSPNLLRSQNHQLQEMQTALPKMNANGIVLLDDNDFENGGKTRLTKEFLKEQGWYEDMEGKQSLWIR